MIEKGVAVHRQPSKKLAGGVEHPAHGAEELGRRDLPGGGVGVDVDRHAGHHQARLGEPAEQDRRIHELVVAVGHVDAVGPALERGARPPCGRIGQPEPHRRSLETFRIADHGVGVDEDMIALDGRAAHPVDRVVERAVPRLGHGVSDGPDSRRLREPPLVHADPVDRHPPSAGVQRLERLHVAPDVHDLVGARCGGGELVDRVCPRESGDSQRHVEEVVRAPVEIDAVGQGRPWRRRRRGRRRRGGGADRSREDEEQREGASLHEGIRWAEVWRNLTPA